MGLFDFLFKNNKNIISINTVSTDSNESIETEYKDIPYSAQFNAESKNIDNEFVPNDYELQDIDCELLGKIDNLENNYYRNLFESHIKNLNKRIDLFWNMGLLCEATLEEKLCFKYNNSDLKNLLKTLGLKVSGSKTELVKRLIENISAEELISFTNDVKKTMLTEKGAYIYNTYVANKNQLKANTEENVLNLILENKYIEATKEISKYESNKIFKRGIGIDWEKSSFKKELFIINHIMNTDYLSFDFDIANNEKRKIKALIAADVLWGEGTNKVAKKIIEISKGSFFNQTIFDFLTNNPCGDFASSFSSDEDTDIAVLFAHTMYFEALSTYELNEIKVNNYDNGVEIVDIGDNCRICSKGKKKYKWDEIENIPKLPRHPGCRCSYGVWWAKN